jgi:hypothetical protein
MELGALETAQAHNEGAEMRVRGPDGEYTDFYIMLSGMDSTTWRKAARDVKRKVVEVMSAGGEVDIDFEAESLAASTIGWRGLESDGEAVEFNVDTAFSLYKNAPYIQDQADRFMGDRANFIKG